MEEKMNHKKKQKNIDELAQYIGFDEAPYSWKIAAEKIELSSIKTPKWLDKKYITKILEFYGLLDLSFKKKCFDMIDQIIKDISLIRICNLCHYILYLDQTGLYQDIWNWKETDKMYENAGSYMLPVLVLLSGYETHLKNMVKRNFDEEQIKEQKRNIVLSCTSDKNRFFIDGIRFSQMVWGSYFMKGKIIQVGRLQYEYKENIPSVVREYKDGDYMYIHIPKGHDLNPKEVNESLTKSREKIRMFFPEIEISKLQYCTKTWLLSDELKEILKQDSNIIQFQKKFQILEQIENIGDFLNFVFQERNKNISYEKLKEETTLQKKLKEMLIHHKVLHIGVGVVK